MAVEAVTAALLIRESDYNSHAGAPAAANRACHNAERLRIPLVACHDVFAAAGTLLAGQRMGVTIAAG
jgi:hypothetical protein